nr:NADH-quinone oxidoreductase subunit H [Candidatus Njordarchaeota archaeon]
MIVHQLDFLEDIGSILQSVLSTIFELVEQNSFLLFKVLVFPGLLFIIFSAITLVWLERKIWGRIQDRRGPTYIGKFGTLQLIADAIKLLSKETIVPSKAYRLMYRFLPILNFAAVAIGIALIPFSEEWAIGRSNVSLILVYALLTVIPVVGLLAGWASGSKYPLVGGFRFASQQFGFGVPLLLSAVAPALLAGSIDLMIISQRQSVIWFIVFTPLSFITFIVASVAEISKVPLDIPDADAEIVWGWRTEYSGVYFLIYYFAQYLELFLFAGMATALFLGGGSGIPFLPPVLTYLVKMFVVSIMITVITSSLHRVRMDQLLRICWRILLPLTLLNIAGIMLVLAYFPQLLPVS